MDTDNTNHDQSTKAARQDELFYPNDILIQELWLQIGPIRRADVRRLLVNLDIYEDLYNNVLTAQLTLIDAINLIGNLPVTGQEQVEIVFKTPGFPGRPETRMLFEVYKVSSRNVGAGGGITDTTQVYTLHLISPVFFRNQQRRVMKAFTNKSIADMVGEIAANDLGELVEAERTTGQYSFVIPRWTPLRTINWLTARARSESNPHAANYFFFETLLDGFFFRSVEGMVQQAPRVTFTYEQGNKRIPDEAPDRSGKAGQERALQPEVQMIRNYTVMETGTTLDRIDQGMYASKLITHDIVKKDFTFHEFNYDEDFKRVKHTESALADTGSGRSGQDEVQQDPVPFPGIPRHGREFDSVVKFYPKHSQLFDGIPDYDASEKWLQQRMTQLRQLEAQRVQIEVPGLNFLQVGQMVMLEVPKPEALRANEPVENIDRKVSGKYLVTSIHHVISTDEHKMIVELSKESLRTAPDAAIANIVPDNTTPIDISGGGLRTT